MVLLTDRMTGQNQGREEKHKGDASGPYLAASHLFTESHFQVSASWLLSLLTADLAPWALLFCPVKVYSEDPSSEVLLKFTPVLQITVLHGNFPKFNYCSEDMDGVLAMHVSFSFHNNPVREMLLLSLFYR